jgi:hypothetical protein
VCLGGARSCTVLKFCAAVGAWPCTMLYLCADDEPDPTMLWLHAIVVTGPSTMLSMTAVNNNETAQIECKIAGKARPAQALRSSLGGAMLL